jgi:hypothetical protein
LLIGLLKFPRYFDGRVPSGRDTESAVLEYSLPNFKVLPPHPLKREARRELINQGRMKGMILEAARNRPSLNVMIENQKSGSDRIGSFDENIYGLEKYSVKDWENMLVRSYIAYLEKKKNEIESFILCSPPNQDRNPNCRHTFINKGILYRIRWPIRELPNWKEQQEKAIDFIDSLEIMLHEQE